MSRALRPGVTVGVALLGASLIAVPPAGPTEVQMHPVRLTSGEEVAFIIGGSGTPIPPPSYVDAANSLYIQPLFPGYDPEPLFTPEGNYALYTGVKSLTLDQSEAQGATILNNAITEQVADGNRVAVFGESQSSTISSIVMPQLADQGVPNSDVGFVLVGDPNLPNGGLFERLDGVTIPSLGITFNGATPDDLYPTTIYTQAYDGFADIPRYPINFLSDLNSILGIQFVHPTYRDLTPEQLASAIQLPTVGDTMTTYYMLPTEDLPLLDLVRPIPVIGTPLADLLQPILTPLVNLGYGDPDFGWDTGPANVPTEFGLFPSLDMTIQALQEMMAGVPTGIQAATVDLAAALNPTSILEPGPVIQTAATDALGADPLSEFTNIVNALTGAFSTAYAALLPTADVLTGVAVTIPNYDVQWFTDGLLAGDLVGAIGQPIANDTYLLSLAAGFEIFALISSAESIADDLSGLVPF